MGFNGRGHIWPNCFGHPYLAAFGQNHIWPIPHLAKINWPQLAILIWAEFGQGQTAFGLFFVLVRARKGGGGADGVGGAKFRAFFFSLPPEMSFFLLSLGVFSWNWWCLKRRGPKCARLESVVCDPGGPVWWGRRGSTRHPESPNVHI